MKRMRDGSYTIKPTYKVGEHDIIPDMRKSRFDEWDRNYAYDVVKHEPVPFIYNDTGVLWEEKMGVDFTSASWYEDFEDIKSHIYKNITKCAVAIPSDV